jgi:hypothetical protein
MMTIEFRAVKSAGPLMLGTSGKQGDDARPAAHRVSRLVRSKFLRIRHIRKVERLASFRQRDPGKKIG